MARHCEEQDDEIYLYGAMKIVEVCVKPVAGREQQRDRDWEEC